MVGKKLFVGLFCIVSFFCTSEFSLASSLTIHTEMAVNLELIGYDSLRELVLSKGSIKSAGEFKIETAYRGLALLRFPAGQVYPLIISDDSFGLHIVGPDKLPTFTDSKDNEIFYRLLTSGKADINSNSSSVFARLMIDAKHLLDSSHSIRSFSELTAKKEEFHNFVRKHYQSLKQSDMIRRLIAQYFMMHEYADYHIEGAPASDIKKKYQQEVVGGVDHWLQILQPHIPEHEIVNYCVSLYYQRSMVTLASLIVEKYRDAAYCPGAQKQKWNFPQDLLLREVSKTESRQLKTIKGSKVIAFVSDDCPVSSVETVVKVRQLANNQDIAVIIAPLQPLSEKHLTISRMVLSKNMFFINDENWPAEHLKEKPRLPLFIQQ